MQYIFINPVVDRMYEKEALNRLLNDNDYRRIEVEIDWHQIVREKYKRLVQETELTVVDKRCPKAVESIEAYVNSNEIKGHSIEPILIHCGIELSQRKTLKGYKKLITTPCKSLASYGNQLQLEDTEFISWKELHRKLDPQGLLQAKELGASPIPPGYFSTLSYEVSSISGEETIETYFKTKQYKEDRLVEMLYCHNGCHNGDGVLMDE